MTAVDFDEFFARFDATLTPAERAQLKEAEAEMDRAVPVPCAWGWCTHYVDPVTNKIVYGGGPVACPCDHLPGWRSSFVDGQAKPSVPVKVRGRHGSRVHRSRLRHRLPDLRPLVEEWLTEHPSVYERRIAARDAAAVDAAPDSKDTP